MKVCELIAALYEMPAGAEVSFSTVMSAEELKVGRPVDEEDGVEYYSVSEEIKDVELVDTMRVSVYN